MADTLKVNPINCTGHGVCAELLPELISLDEWGYPIIDPRPVPPILDRDARRAVAACPALALKLMRSEEPLVRPDPRLKRSRGRGTRPPRSATVLARGDDPRNPPD